MPPKLNIFFDAYMKKIAITLSLILALLFSVVAGAQFVNSAQANPYHREAIGTKVSPPVGTQAPIITIHTPQNGSYHSKNLTLTFDVTIPKTNGDKSIDAVTKLYYKGSWEPNEITITQFNQRGYQEIIEDSASFSIDLSSVPRGQPLHNSLRRWRWVLRNGIKLRRKNLHHDYFL